MTGCAFRACSARRLYGAAVPVFKIEDPADARLSDYVGLSDPQLRRRVEIERGFFVAESPLVVQGFLRSGRTVRSVLVTPAQHDALESNLSGLAAPVYVADPDILRQVVGFDLHRGAVASGDRWPLPAPSTLLQRARRVAVVQKITDHENLGGVFRNAAAFGIDAVLLDGESADPLYRRCVRVSIGHVLTVPWTRIGALAELRESGFTLVALTPAPGARPLRDFDWPERCALLFGSEGPGLSSDWLSEADVQVRIPMQPGVDSLNVATAAAISFYACT